MVHLARFRSMCAHSTIFLSFLIWGCMFWMLFVSSVGLFVCVVEGHVLCEVLKW